MPKKKQKKIKVRKPRSLVVHRVENVSKDVFKKYFPLIKDLIGNSPGIYALYDGTELYYVGKSTDLRKRVNQHLKDRHLASWTNFSLYLVRNSEHIQEIESLLIRISNPKGNRVFPKAKSSGSMLKKLKGMVKEKQKEEFKSMFGIRSRLNKKDGDQQPKNLKGLVKKRTMLFKAYKGKEYKAYLLKNGTIRYGNKIYSSPTAAAKTITKRSINGWDFWYIKDSKGDWVRLKQYPG